MNFVSKWLSFDTSCVEHSGIGTSVHGQKRACKPFPLTDATTPPRSEYKKGFVVAVVAQLDILGWIHESVGFLEHAIHNRK